MRSKPRPFLWLSVFALAALFPLLISVPFPKHLAAVYSKVGPGQQQIASLRTPRAPIAHSVADKPSVFDPVLVYSTLLGGLIPNFAASTASTAARAGLVDSAGNVFVLADGGVPTTSGVIQENPCQNCTGSLSKIDPTGQSLIFSTYFVGPGARALAVDSFGNIYVGGLVPPPSLNDRGSASILPIPPGTTPFQASPKGLNIGILKLNSTATTLLAATYLGGSGLEDIGGLAIDADGNVCIVGTTTSNDFPVSKGALQTSLGTSGQNVFVTKLDTNLSSAVYSTYLGQNSSASVGNPANAYTTHTFQGMPAGHSSLAVDALKNVYVAGNAGQGFPTTSTGIQTTCSGGCPFVAKLDPAGTSLLYSTYLADSSTQSEAYALALDAAQNVYVGGVTGLAGATGVYSTTPNALQPCTTSGGFISEIDSTGSLKFSTCLGAGGGNGIVDMSADSAQNLHVVGYGGLPLNNPIQSNPGYYYYSGPFVASISPNSNPPSILFSSYVGSGLQNDQDQELQSTSVGTDSNGNLYVIGSVYPISGDSFPVFNALQPTAPIVGSYGGVAFIWKIGATDAPAAALEPAAISFPPQQVGVPSTTQTINVIDLGSAPLTISSVTTTGDFSVQNNCTTTVAAAGGTCTLVVTYTPSGVGTGNGTLTITDNSAGSPHTAQLTGQGAVPSVTVAPNTLSFPTQFVGSTSTGQTVAITNPGPLNFQISRIATTGDFAEANNCGAVIVSNGSCTVTVTFTPSATGNHTGSLSISDGASGSPQTVALSGTGGTASLGLGMATGSSGSAKFNAGSNVTFTLSIGGEGMAGTASLACTGAPAAATCTVPATTSVSATTASTFNAVVTTTARTQASLRPNDFWRAPWAWGFALIGCIILARASSRGSRFAYLGFAVLFVLALSSCGGGSSNPHNGGTMVGTPAGTYTLVVTATSGSATQTQNLTLVIQ
jgi:hypothetical protein